MRVRLFLTTIENSSQVFPGSAEEYSKRAARKPPHNNTRKDRKMENATQTVSQVEKISLSIEETVNHLFQIFKEAPSAVRSRTFNRDAEKFNYAVNYEEAVNILVADGRLRRSSKGALTVIAPRAPKIATEAAPIPAEGSPLAEALAAAEAESAALVGTTVEPAPTAEDTARLKDAESAALVEKAIRTKAIRNRS